MNTKRIAAAAALAIGSFLSTAAAPNWVATVTLTDGGHMIGNPAATVKLTEYISYTCPHCAAFAREGEEPLKLAYIAPGKLTLEVRHLLRDPVDLTAALLTNCGAPAKFPQNHSAFMLSQNTWMPKMQAATDAQTQRWFNGPNIARRRAIASDLGFYAIMERRGYGRVAVDQCLGDEALATRLADTAGREWKLPGIGGTPAFAINGTVLTGTHNWASLEPQLKARF
ncbi:MAG: hypothetical protein RLZZ08_1494 [Pseudomonadota bacterium]|jgi:protein-disulfide isomerase